MKAGWERKQIADVAVVFDGPHATPKTVDAGPIFLGIGALQDGTINLGETRHVTPADFRQWTRRVKPQTDDVVFSYETRLGEAAIIPEGLECCLGRRMGLIRFDKAQVLPRFFLYQYISPPFREFLSSKIVRGATVDRISIKEFPSFPIAIPPLPEQQRIVGILDEAFEGIATAKANAERNLQNARALFESHLQSVFTQRGEGWKQKPLGLLCELISGQHIDAKDYNTEGRGVGYLTGPSDFGFLNPVITKWSEHPKRMAKRGDILVTVKGSGVGKINLLDAEEVAISRQLMAVRTTIADVSYLYAFLSTKFDYFQSLTKGAAIPGISREDVLDLMCPMPPPEEQHAIVQLIHATSEETQRLESIYQQKLAALDELKKSLLHQAFTGQL